MPLSVDDVVHENSGGAAAASTSIVVSLAGADQTTAGNTVLVVICTSTVSGITPAAGFVLDHSVTSASTHGIRVYRKPPTAVTTGETSWTFTGAASADFAWYVREMSGLDPDGPLDATASGSGTTGTATGGTKSTGTTGVNAGLTTVQIGFWGCQLLVSNPPGTWDSYTNGFTEHSDARSTGSPGRWGLATADNLADAAVGPFDCTATYTGTTTVETYAGMVVYRAADSPVLTPLNWFATLGQGTHNGLASSLSVGTAQFLNVTGTVGTDLIVETASARTDLATYGLKIVQSAAAKSLSIGAGAQMPASLGVWVLGWALQPVSSTGTVVLAEVLPASGTALQVVYDTSTSKVGVRWGSGGTASWQTGTTTASDYPWIDLRVRGVNSATWHVDWSIEESGVATVQSSPADLTGQTASTISSARWGSNTSQTVTQRISMPVASSYGGAWPRGPHRAKLLKVDPSGTPTVTGTIGNLALLTNNVTGAALTSGTVTTARDNIDELPVNRSATADGIGQTATDTATYISFPMETYTVSATEVIVAVRLIAALVSTTGAGAGTLGVNGHDGTASTALFPTSVSSTPGSSTTLSNTVPVWVVAMWNPAGGWTQDKLNAAALEVGRSTDATPDMFVEVAYLEVAVADAVTQQLFGDLSTSAVNPNNAGLVSVTVDAPADRGVTLCWEEGGVPGTPVAVGAASSHTEQFNAPDVTTINRVEVESDPELPDRY